MDTAALLESMDYRPWISGAAQPKLTQDRLMGIRIAVPPPEEQALIVEAFNKEAAPITLSIQELLQEASLLREYRTRLIADVVTGKLDVREVAAGLPEEVEPSIQSDAAGVDGGEAEDDLDSDPIDTEED
jgi:type I restriction enzyme S subunit